MQRIGEVQRGEDGALSVAASVPFALLSKEFELFRAEYPGVSTKIAENTCSASCALVRQRLADIAFVIKPPSKKDAQSLHLRDEPMMVVLPTSHRLSGKDPVTFAELRGERFVLGSVGLEREIADRLRSHMAQMGDEPNIELHCVGQCDLVAMVGRGFGITLIIGAQYQAAPDEVVVVPLADKHFVSLYAVWMETNPNPALNELLAIVSPRTG